MGKSKEAAAPQGTFRTNLTFQMVNKKRKLFQPLGNFLELLVKYAAQPRFKKNCDKQNTKNTVI